MTTEELTVEDNGWGYEYKLRIRERDEDGNVMREIVRDIPYHAIWMTIPVPLLPLTPPPRPART